MTATDNLQAMLDRAKSQLPAAEPIFMLNLCATRMRRLMEAARAMQRVPAGYIAAFAKATKGYGIEPFGIGKVCSLLVVGDKL